MNSVKTSTNVVTKNWQVVEQANRVIRQVAEAEKYDIIFQDAVYASPRIDITDKVIKALEGKPPAR